MKKLNVIALIALFAIVNCKAQQTAIDFRGRLGVHFNHPFQINDFLKSNNLTKINNIQSPVAMFGSNLQVNRFNFSISLGLSYDVADYYFNRTKFSEENLKCNYAAFEIKYNVFHIKAGTFKLGALVSATGNTLYIQPKNATIDFEKLNLNSTPGLDLTCNSILSGVSATLMGDEGVGIRVAYQRIVNTPTWQVNKLETINSVSEKGGRLSVSMIFVLGKEMILKKAKQVDK